MNHFRIIWEIDIYADSPQEAAQEALDIQRDEESMATVFDVFDEKGLRYRIDLLEDDDGEDIEMDD